MKVREDAKYNDVTFCSNFKCKKKTCYRHICHNCDEYLVSIADFEGRVLYCLKALEQAKKK